MNLYEAYFVVMCFVWSGCISFESSSHSLFIRVIGGFIVALFWPILLMNAAMRGVR